MFGNVENGIKVYDRRSQWDSLQGYWLYFITVTLLAHILQQDIVEFALFAEKLNSIIF